MPLLHSKPFVKNRVSKCLNNSDEVFYCKQTKEIFLKYEQYYKRIVLCNSRVWSCKVTGKKNMTYREAVNYEKKSKILLNDFPYELQKPILYLLSLTKYSSLKDLIDQIYNFVRNRFFVSEIVYASILKNHPSLKYRILAVYSPSDPTFTGRYNCCTTPIFTTKHGSNTRAAHASYFYKLKPVNNGTQIKYLEPIHIVKGNKIQRSQGCFTRNRCGIFISHNVKFKNGFITLKNCMAKRITSMIYEDVFSREFLTIIQETEEEKRNMNEKRKKEIEILSKYQKEWGKKKEVMSKFNSLKLDGSEELPDVIPVDLHFGDFLMMKEFFDNHTHNKNNLS